MFRIRQPNAVRPLFRNRYADEWVGLLVLGALVLFVGAIVEAGFLKQWLTPEGRIHFVLPESGVAGLSIGDDIEALGVHVGEIRKLDLNEEGHMYAEGTIEPHFERFIRTDSTAVIRHRFVVAGASYIELGRGRGQQLDWKYAVLNATVEPNPADVITQTVVDLRNKLVPAMNNVQAITGQVNDMVKEMRAGKGTVGALLTRDDLVRKAGTALDTLDATIARLQPLERQLGGVMARADGTLDNARSVTSSLKNTMPAMHSAVVHADAATTALPALITQAEASASSLRQLMNQLRGLWLLGGGSSSDHQQRRLPARAVRP